MQVKAQGRRWRTLVLVLAVGVLILMGSVGAAPSDGLEIAQTLSSNTLEVRSCKEPLPTVTVTLTVQGTQGVTPLDLVLVVDRSSSENLSRVQGAALAFLDHLGAQDRVALVSFADQARLEQGLTEDLAAVRRAVEALVPGDLTALGEALALALDELIAQGRDREDARPGLIVISDGGNTAGRDPRPQAERARDEGIPIYFVGLTGKVSRAELSRLAELAGGRFFAAFSDQTLAGVLKKLGRKIAAQFMTITETLPEALRFEGSLESEPAPQVTFNERNGTTRLEWAVPLLLTGEVWQTAFKISAGDTGKIPLNRASEVSYLDEGGLRITQTLPNPELEVSGIPPPRPAITMTPQRPKAGEEVAFSSEASRAPGSTITKWEWDFGDGQKSTEPNPTHTYQDLGRYTVTLTVTNAEDCAASASVTFRISEAVTVLPPTEPPTTRGTGPQVEIVLDVDEPTTATEITFSVEQTTELETEITSCEWDFGDGSSSDRCQAKHRYERAGTYTVKLTVTFEDGRRRTVTHRVTVAEKVENKRPVAKFSFLPEHPKANEPVVFDSSDSSDPDGSVEGWAWDFGDGQKGTEPNPVHTYEAPGVYEVVLVVTDDDGEESEPFQATVTVGVPPEVLAVEGPSGVPEVPEWMDFYIDGGVVTDEELDDAARRFANGSYVQGTQYRLTQADLRHLTELHDLRLNTAKYRDPVEAEADGYEKVGSYIAGVGQHYIKADWIDEEKPPQFDRVPILLYAEDEAGRLSLAGVRYVAFEEAEAVLFGIAKWPSFKPKDVDAKVYVLTVWVWLENPDGMFNPRNPRVK